MTTVNLVIFGIGNVGSTLVEQVESARSVIEKQQGIRIRIPVIANSKQALFHFEDQDQLPWDHRFKRNAVAYTLQDICAFVRREQLEHLIAVDATASKDLVRDYQLLIESGFHLVAANKIANTLDFEFYQNLRKHLENNQKKFFYETNVGAGLPVVDTVKGLHDSGEMVTKIKGVFSGSLSYVFNRFSSENIPFSEVLTDAVEQGFTEPDAREDLSGSDVARKLLILAREIGLKTELKDVEVESLVPSNLNGSTSLAEFKSRVHELDEPFEAIKTGQAQDRVLRYIGELDAVHNKVKVALLSEPAHSDFAQLKGTDALFEIYTESYGSRPLIIKGAGAGKDVTARGVCTDILKIAKLIKTKHIEYQH
jgi:homoserine dehydrogenase